MIDWTCRCGCYCVRFGVDGDPPDPPLCNDCRELDLAPAVVVETVRWPSPDEVWP